MSVCSCIFALKSVAVYFLGREHNLISLGNHHNRFTALFPGPPGWAGDRREILDFMVQGKINRGRHTDHPVGRHSIRTRQCLPPSSHLKYYAVLWRLWALFLWNSCRTCICQISVKGHSAKKCQLGRWSKMCIFEGGSLASHLSCHTSRLSSKIGKYNSAFLCNNAGAWVLSRVFIDALCSYIVVVLLIFR